jgi:hypothetical protein
MCLAMLGTRSPSPKTATALLALESSLWCIETSAKETSDIPQNIAFSNPGMAPEIFVILQAFIEAELRKTSAALERRVWFPFEVEVDPMIVSTEPLVRTPFQFVKEGFRVMQGIAHMAREVTFALVYHEAFLTLE